MDPQSQWFHSLKQLEYLLTEDKTVQITAEIQQRILAADEGEQRVLVALAIADILAQRQHFNDALALILDASSWNGNEQLQLWLDTMKVRLYLLLNQPHQAWAVTESLLPHPDHERPEDIGIYIQWLTGMMELNRWSQWQTMKPRLEKFLDRAVQQNPALILTSLQKTYNAYLRMGCLRETRFVQRIALRTIRTMQGLQTPGGMPYGQSLTRQRSSAGLRQKGSGHHLVPRIDHPHKDRR